MTSFALRHRTFLMVMAALALVSGLIAFLTMSRREDPELRIRTAKVICQWPGAPAEKVDQLIVDVLEGAIQRVEEVDEIASKSRAGLATITVDLDKNLIEFEQVWDEIRNELRAVERQLPSGAAAPIVNSNFGDVSAVCLTMFQTIPSGAQQQADLYRYTDRQLQDYAEAVEDALEEIESVGSATIFGLREERIYLEVHGADWAKLGITVDDLVGALGDRNIVVPSGALETSSERFLLRATGEFRSLGELQQVIVGRNTAGQPVFLRDLPIKVKRTYDDLESERVRYFDTEHRVPRAVLIGVEMKGGRNVVEMGAEVMARLDGLRSTVLPPDLEFATVNDLPRQVDSLVWNFIDNLWQAILIVLVVAFLMMGWRPAVVMATAVPLCMITALSVVGMFGVELEQFSIASLIISLGMIVDNAIVVSDQTMSLLRAGETRFRAALRGAQDLAVPILTSTATTVAAFVPLLTIPGGTGEYMRSLPIVVSCTLIASYFVAMTVTPILCFWLLKPGEEEAKADGRVAALYERLVRLCLRFKAVTLGAALAMLFASFLLVPFIGNQFFPGGQRDQFFVHLRLPNGASLQETARVAEAVETIIRETSKDADGDDRLKNAYTFLGSGGPRLMLTMNAEDPALNYGFIVVNTNSATATAGWVEEVRARTANVPGARVDVRAYMLGPAVEFPVEYRVSGLDAKTLRRAGDELVDRLAAVEGIADPYHNWGNATYQVEVQVDERTAELAGLSNRAVASSINDLVSGRRLTDYREGDESIPVELRLAASERAGLAALDGIYVGGRSGKVPLDTVASIETSWQPAQIARFARKRAITVGSQVESGYLATEVSARGLAAVREALEPYGPGVVIEELGETKESTESQGDIGNALMLSMALILLVLVAQYNSLAKPLVVLSAVPLALVGALVGLFVTGWPLGFMPSLGIVSLAGVVINNAIILIDFIQSEVAGGAELDDAVASAGRVRMRPIVLTTLTTIGGLLPLAFFGGPMWAGMAFAMIFGLMFSTVLTLVVVPTIYAAFVAWFGMQVLPKTEEA